MFVIGRLSFFFLLRAFVLLVLLDAGEKRFQPPSCAFTMSIQKGDDLETQREMLEKTSQCTHHMESRSLGSGGYGPGQ